ncbi:MAG: hypothetical protein NXI20_05735 [bacterium]|nr:hypothetical protein [bacterium]
MDVAVDFWQDYWYLFVIIMLVLPGFRILKRNSNNQSDEKED